MLAGRLALAVVGLPVEFGWIRGSFPQPGLSALPKILLVDSALYAFLVVRRLEGVGYDFRARARDLVIGLRECAFFAPIVIALGIGIGFITPHGGIPSSVIGIGCAAGHILFRCHSGRVVFSRSAPESSRTTNWLSRLAVRNRGIFGLSHFNKPLPFNWRYVLLATIAGIFYGRAWHDRRRLLSSATTHTLVDVIWSLWFR